VRLLWLQKHIFFLFGATQKTPGRPPEAHKVLLLSVRQIFQQQFEFVQTQTDAHGTDAFDL